MDEREQIRGFYKALMAAWGAQDWWPAHSRFEVIVGAFLTQNTAWSNVERALQELRRAGLLNVEGIRRTPLGKLQRMVRSAGYFRQKAQRLKNFVGYLDEHYGGSLTRMFALPSKELRKELLSLNGIGPETADSILLYAGGHPVFVVDAYTRRILDRHGLLPPKAGYEEIRALVEGALGDDPPVVQGSPVMPLPSRRRRKLVVRCTPAAEAFNEFHALLVQAAKHHCLKSQAQCKGCPLEKFLQGS